MLTGQPKMESVCSHKLSQRRAISFLLGLPALPPLPCSYGIPTILSVSHTYTELWSYSLPISLLPHTKYSCQVSHDLKKKKRKIPVPGYVFELVRGPQPTKTHDTAIVPGCPQDLAMASLGWRFRGLGKIGGLFTERRLLLVTHGLVLDTLESSLYINCTWPIHNWQICF